MRRGDRKRWLRALRSGEYKQGITRLRGDDWFCPLGVYADVCIEGEWEWKRKKGWGLLIKGSRWERWLPGSQIKRQLQREVSYLGDHSAMSLKEIADWIEENVPPGD